MMVLGFGVAQAVALVKGCDKCRGVLAGRPRARGGWRAAGSGWATLYFWVPF